MISQPLFFMDISPIPIFHRDQSHPYFSMGSVPPLFFTEIVPPLFFTKISPTPFFTEIVPPLFFTKINPYFWWHQKLDTHHIWIGTAAGQNTEGHRLVNTWWTIIWDCCWKISKRKINVTRIWKCIIENYIKTFLKPYQHLQPALNGK